MSRGRGRTEQRAARALAAERGIGYRAALQLIRDRRARAQARRGRHVDTDRWRDER